MLKQAVAAKILESRGPTLMIVATQTPGISLTEEFFHPIFNGIKERNIEKQLKVYSMRKPRGLNYLPK